MKNIGFHVVCAVVMPLFCAIAGHSGLPAASGELRGNEIAYAFFDSGKALCEIILPDNPAPRELEAGRLIKDVFDQMGGVDVAMVQAPSDTPVVHIHIGDTPFTRRVFDQAVPENFNADGFVIQPVDAHNIVLMGACDLSTFYAATELLERYAGALWVWPGTVGTVIPRVDALEANVRAQVSAPAFWSRRFSGMYDSPMKYWRIHQHPDEIRAECGHNTHKVVKANMFKEHPEYFPWSRVAGKRQRLERWQICTSNPDVIELFIEAAKSAFREYPYLRAYSTSAHDAPVESFCQCDACLALDVPGVDGLGDRWFTFANAVADGIKDEFPDRFIANLAYSAATRNPPAAVKLRQNVMPFLVMPTMQDVHADVAAWDNAAYSLGIYFWLHGKPTPQFFPKRFAEYLRFIRDHNARAVYAEVYQVRQSFMASWELDGPRIWLFGKLLWNPDADVDQLMDVFLSRFYGAAAEPMRRFYQRLEFIMERRENPYEFGRDHAGTGYDLYKRADIEILDVAMKEALVLADGDDAVTTRLLAQQQAMAHLVSYCMFEDISELLAAMPIENGMDARAVIAVVNEQAQKAANGNLSWKVFIPAGAESAIDARFAGITAMLGQQAPEFWREMEQSYPLLARFIHPQLTGFYVEENHAIDPGFEDVTAKDLEAGKGWVVKLRPNTPGRVSIVSVAGASHSGKSALLFEGVTLGASVVQRIAVKEGERYRVSCWIKSDGKTGGPGHRHALELRWRTPRGDRLDALQHKARIVVAAPDGVKNWEELSVVATMPKDATFMDVAALVGRQPANAAAWFDDFTIERLYPLSTARQALPIADTGDPKYRSKPVNSEPPAPIIPADDEFDI